MMPLKDFISESMICESEYDSLLKEIDNLTQAKNADEFNKTFEVISSMIRSMDQTVEFKKYHISNLEEKSFYCTANRYADIKGDDPKYHGDCIGGVSIGPGKGKVAHIHYNSNLGGNLDRTGGDFVVVDAWPGGFKKDVFADSNIENSIRCLSEDKVVKKFVTTLVKNAK